MSTPIELFTGLSAVLTGIDQQKLAPQLDPNHIAQELFDYAKAHGGATFNQLLSIYDQNQGQPPAKIGDIILNQSGSAVRYLARSIMLMWYLGSWYDPSTLQAYDSPNPPGGPVPAAAVISSNAYTLSWTWNVAQAHPMGDSNLNFGYWSQDPPPLSDFIGGQTDAATGGKS